MKPTGHTKWISPEHALYVGAVWGVAMKHNLPVHPVLDENGDYTDRLEIKLGKGTSPYIITIQVVVPPPPPEWKLSDWVT